MNKRMKKKRDREHERQNALIASKIDINKLRGKLQENPSILLHTNDDGTVLLDPNNPWHREWLED